MVLEPSCMDWMINDGNPFNYGNYGWDLVGNHEFDVWTKFGGDWK